MQDPSQATSEPEPRGAPGLEARPLVSGLLLGLVLFVGTFWLFAVSIPYGLTPMDDALYLFNRWVPSGWTKEGVFWAFTSTISAIPQPLTLLSLMWDVEAAGLNPERFRTVNILLHCASSVLVFVLFRAAKLPVFFSFLVALIFAVHPQRIESVVWIAERKDVLWVFLGLSSLVMHVIWRRTQRAPWKTLSFFLLLLALLAKPQAVVVPLLAVLLDLWPLNTNGFSHSSNANSWNRLLVWSWKEAVDTCHLFFLGFLFGVGTILSSALFGITEGLGSVPISYRLALSAKAYFSYLREFFVHGGACMYYHATEFDVAPWLIAGWLPILAALAALVYALFRKEGWLFFGGFWFFLALLPTSGIMQTGSQLIAHRYSYLPSIGLGLILVGVVEFLFKGNKLARVGLLSWIVFLGVRTVSEIPYLKDPIPLWQRTLELSEERTPNWFAREALAFQLRVANRHEEALTLMEPFKLKPKLGPAYVESLLALNRDEEAAILSKRLFLSAPKEPAVLAMLATAAKKKGDVKAAEFLFRQLLIFNPNSTSALGELARIYQQTGRYEKALLLAERAVAEAPNNLSVTGQYYFLLRETLGPEESARKLLDRCQPVGRNSAPYLSIVRAELSVPAGLQVALKYAKEGYDKNPFDTQLALLYLEALLSSGDWDEATRILAAFNRKRPEFQRALISFTMAAFQEASQPKLTKEQQRRITSVLTRKDRNTVPAASWLALLCEAEEMDTESLKEEFAHLKARVQQSPRMLAEIDRTEVAILAKRATK